MQTAHYVIAACVGALALLAYVFQAGKWAAARERLDDKVDGNTKRIENHDKALTTHNTKINDLDNRLSRVESDRRIVIFPRRRRIDEGEEEDHE